MPGSSLQAYLKHSKIWIFLGNSPIKNYFILGIKGSLICDYTESPLPGTGDCEGRFYI